MIIRTEDNLHPFGGCNKLLSQYATIGSALQKYEHSMRRLGALRSSAFVQFRAGVSFVSVEVLESYLEDLLDLDVDESKLFIESRTTGISWVVVAALGLCAAIATGLMATSRGASLPVSFGLTLALAFPFGLLWHFAPRDAAARRMTFAQVLSHEVSRRRGTDKGPRADVSSGFLFGDLLAQKTPGSARSAAAKVITTIH
jgi:hypothetical protein